MSRNRRRAAAPSRISAKSSGEKKTVLNRSLRAAALLAGTPLIEIFRRFPLKSETSVKKSR
jgi:hypothetical protein